MLLKLKATISRIWQSVLSGVGNCAKCGCGQYEQSDQGGDYCRCGHAYSDHW